MSIALAAPQRTAYKPAFSVEKLPGKRVKTLHQKDDKTKQIIETQVEVDAGYKVVFSKGHSIRISTDAELRRLGFDRTIPLVNDDGDVAGYVPSARLVEATDRNGDGFHPPVSNEDIDEVTDIIASAGKAK